MKKLALLLFLVFWVLSQTHASDDWWPCTMDAKQCSDWSWVWRSWPKCEFVCPADEQKINTKKACTKEYKPVCGSVKVQCFTTPCNPVEQTFSNKCEMESYWNTTFLHEWTCEADSEVLDSTQDEEIMMCPMIYMPVCWVDGVTYGNACSAWKVWVKYNWACLAPKLEEKINSAWDKSVKPKLEKLSDTKKITILQRVINNSSKLMQKEEMESLKANIFNFIMELAKSSLQKDIYEGYITKNISTITSSKPTLGWTWSVTKIEWIDVNTAYVTYEDGHVVEYMDVKLSVKNWKIVTEVSK